MQRRKDLRKIKGMVMEKISKFFLGISIMFISCNQKIEVKMATPALKIETNIKGEVQMVGYTVHDQKEGEWREYRNGALFSIRNYKNGVMHGKQTTYEVNSCKIIEEGQWEDGIPVGLWFFYQEGVLVSITEYKNENGQIEYHNPKFKYADEIPPPPN